MNKVVLTFFLVSLFNTGGFAQSNYSLGVNIGPNYVSYRGSDDILKNTSSDFNFVAGFFLEYKIINKLAVITGLNLESKSIIYKTNYTRDYIDEDTYQIRIESWDIETANKYKYLTVPLLLKYSFGKMNSFFVKGGGFISFLQRHSKRTRAVNDRGQVFENFTSNSNNNFPLADYISGEYGASIGLGKSFRIDNKNIVSVELRDNLGLENTVDRTVIQGVSGVIKTNSLNLILNWSYNL